MQRQLLFTVSQGIKPFDGIIDNFINSQLNISKLKVHKQCRGQQLNCLFNLRPASICHAIQCIYSHLISTF
ncbi:CLUMA_CG019963, isoform A [Clunio marinus]|uniref:CLUMA_CG019963, isoform A n=1 Tax=Clunio marinus TaxID=568069 RepID=A0A1J1J4Q9_9DIPT|nr:CLUMA_CG019963, isoform A [Clunio marinus]